MRRHTTVRRATATALAALLLPPFAGLAREFLLGKEIEQIREAQELDKRTQLYVKFAALRLATFKDRSKGIESKPGDPLEFYSPADLIYGYTRCLKAVQDNVDESVNYKRVEARVLAKALTTLKDFAAKSLPELEEASKYAVDRKNEELYRKVETAFEVTRAAIEGSVEGLRLLKALEKEREQESKKKK